MHHHDGDSATATKTSTLAVPTGRIGCDGCIANVEARLRKNPHVREVHVDAQREIAQVQVDEGPVTAGELAELIADACGDRAAVALPKPEVSSHAHAHTAQPELAGHEHHDMSDPNMAADMEADMKRRFWISLLLSLPVLAYSSLGMLLLGGRELPTPFGIPRDWIMLAFATPVALWTSSVFHIGAYYALKSRVLNMSVLVSLGILTSYLFSVGLTLLAPGQETFYEAAVMLAVFLLFATGWR